MLGVTGPNEYENNVNNNWYTNYIASWCLQYTMEAISLVKEKNIDRYHELMKKMDFATGETKKWQHIVDNMYLPQDDTLGICLQQDNFLDKEIIPVADLDKKHRPINQNWSWDRILRSCFIKQADVLQGFYFFEDHFDEDAHRKNYEFYEPITVHESSLSPCVHGILASKLGMEDKAYEMYLRTARLDLDDYNNDTEDGCHITSMAGTWLAIIKGFGGQRIIDDKISFAPNLPSQWNSLSFKIKFRENLLQVNMKMDSSEIINLAGPQLEIIHNGNNIILPKTA
jgi:maltose phosphorylase